MTTYGLAFEIILENTIIENTKGCFMGKMILEDLRKRLERLDEDADLMIDNNDRYQMVIVGGSAFILLGKLLEGMAEYYSAELSEKVIRGQTENALKGKCTGGTGTIGYKIDDDKFYHLDPLTSPLVLEAFQRYDNGDKMVEIVNFLNDKGVRNMLGGKMTHSSVNTMLKNRRYIGKLSFRDIVVPDAIPVIVPKDLFDRRQKRLDKNKRAPACGKADEEYLLTTKLFCG